MKSSQMFTVAIVTSGLIAFAMELPLAYSQPSPAQPVPVEPVPAPPQPVPGQPSPTMTPTEAERAREAEAGKRPSG